MVEEQLADGRQWLLDTEKPGLVDIDVHFLFSWLQLFKNLKEIYDPAVVPKTLKVLCVVQDSTTLVLTTFTISGLHARQLT